MCSPLDPEIVDSLKETVETYCGKKPDCINCPLYHECPFDKSDSIELKDLMITCLLECENEFVEPTLSFQYENNWNYTDEDLPFRFELLQPEYRNPMS